MRNLKRSGKANFKFIGVSEKCPGVEANRSVDGNGLKAYFSILSRGAREHKTKLFGSCKLSTRNPRSMSNHTTRWSNEATSLFRNKSINSSKYTGLRLNFSRIFE
jgi:hypothetical protein